MQINHAVEPLLSACQQFFGRKLYRYVAWQITQLGWTSASDGLLTDSEIMQILFSFVL
jgi:hypothetical protein